MHYVFIYSRTMSSICSAIHLYVHSFTKHFLGPMHILTAKIFKDEDSGTFIILCFHKAKQTPLLKSFCGNQIETVRSLNVWRGEMSIWKGHLQKGTVAGWWGEKRAWLEGSLNVYFYHPCVGWSGELPDSFFSTAWSYCWEQIHVWKRKPKGTDKQRASYANHV